MAGPHIQLQQAPQKPTDTSTRAHNQAINSAGVPVVFWCKHHLLLRAALTWQYAQGKSCQAHQQMKVITRQEHTRSCKRSAMVKNLHKQTSSYYLGRLPNFSPESQQHQQVSHIRAALQTSTIKGHHADCATHLSPAI